MARRSVREQRFSWSSCEEAVGRSALISATQTPLCSPKALACLLSCMCANVWHVSGVLMRWIWLVASTDAMDALGVAPAVRTWQLFAPGSCSHLAAVRPSCQENACPLSAAAAARAPQLSTSAAALAATQRTDWLRSRHIPKTGRAPLSAEGRSGGTDGTLQQPQVVGELHQPLGWAGEGGGRKWSAPRSARAARGLTLSMQP